MGARQREWARLKRQKLIKQLGSACACCGRKRRLEIDVIVKADPPGRYHGNLEPSLRVSFYIRQIREDNAQVLCKSCNSRKGWKTTDFRTVPDLQPAKNQPW